MDIPERPAKLKQALADYLRTMFDLTERSLDRGDCSEEEAEEIKQVLELIARTIKDLKA
jgi:hypothetical protein